MSETDESEESPGAPERVRRWIARLAIAAFSASFLGLLGLSATAYWSPDNHWIALLDGALRISLFVSILASLPPYVVRFGRQLVDAVSGK